MSDPKTCYAVSSGCYSDYTVHYVFESREDAQAYVDNINEPFGESYRVEEMPFWPAGKGPELMEWWRATAEGLEGEIHADRYTIEKGSDKPHASAVAPYSARHGAFGSVWRFSAFGPTEEWVTKAVADRQYAERLKHLPA